MEMDRGKNLSMLAGLGLGATLMYFLDPRGGGRRRALVRDKGIKAKRKTREAVAGKAEDTRNRLKGAAHEAGLFDASENGEERAT